MSAYDVAVVLEQEDPSLSPPQPRSESSLIGAVILFWVMRRAVWQYRKDARSDTGMILVGYWEEQPAAVSQERKRKDPRRWRMAAQGYR